MKTTRWHHIIYVRKKKGERKKERAGAMNEGEKKKKLKKETRGQATRQQVGVGVSGEWASLSSRL
jgi:hypothetical protein